MGYVAIKGGEDAIENASRLVEYERVSSRTTPLEICLLYTSDAADDLL